MLAEKKKPVYLPNNEVEGGGWTVESKICALRIPAKRKGEGRNETDRQDTGP